MENFLKEKFLNFNKKYQLILPKDKILIALSGGADSVFLLHILNEFKDCLEIDISAIHINHNLRDTAKRDENFCVELCQNLYIPLKVINIDVIKYKQETKTSVEEAARILRYKSFENTAKKFNCNKIATAHNLNDNTETVLLNLIKGAGIDGLKGIPVYRNNIIRPILNFSKNEILQYLEKNKIAYVTDETNFDNLYQRNYLRNEIIPKIKNELNPRFDNAIFNLSKNIEIDFEDIIDYEFYENALFIKKNYWNSLQIKRIIKKKLNLELNSKHLDSLFALINSKVSKTLSLPDGFIALNDREYIVIYKDFIYDKNEVFLIGFKNFFLDTNFFDIFVNIIDINDVNINNKKDNEEYIDFDKIESRNLVVRRWGIDDFFFPLGSKGKQKISDFLNNIKVPIIQKKNIWVLADKHNIIAVLGYRIDNRYKINDETKKVLKICYNRKTKL